MARYHPERVIRELKHRTLCVDELVEITHSMNNRGIDNTHEGIPWREFEARLGLTLTYSAKREAKHLEEIGVLDEFRQPGTPEHWAIADWKAYGDGIINGEVGDNAEEAVEALIYHLVADDHLMGKTAVAADGGRETLREILSNEFALSKAGVEQYLRTGDQVEKLNTAVDAIGETSGISIGKGYGEIRFISPPNHYRLSRSITELYRK